MRPIAACAMVMVERTRVSQVTPETPSIPRAMVLTVSCALSRRPGFLATVAPEKLASQELDASVGASGPHAFSVRLGAVRQKRRRVHRIPPNVRDDRDTPLSKGRDSEKCGADLGVKSITPDRGRLARRAKQSVSQFQQ